MPNLATDAQVRAARLTSHGLRGGGGFASIGEAVRRLGAVQAQDFVASKWVVGARVPGATEGDVDSAIASREIVRSWPLRGTLHLVPATSLRPILAVTGARELARAAKRHRDLEIDDEVVRQARFIAERELTGGRSLSRDELFAQWQRAGIATAAQRGYHLIWTLALQAVVCAGPVEGRGQRFVLLDEWFPAAKPGDQQRDETLAALLTAYLDGHGPATVRDFAWWSGLTLGDARTAHAAAGDAVEMLDDERLVIAGADASAPGRSGGLALAPFDEYFLGYADRSAVCDARYADRVVPGSNGVFQPILVTNGRVEGVWKAKQARGGASVVLDPFESPIDAARYAGALRRWARFRGIRLEATSVLEG
ncbi:winged helix DNA-binding domain-containing protein [Agromyces sp. SYSU K20354]|uniref:winged helix DNA-binding domain-containing protein n=1 Tax=Agromyces cavernae TaxID=2898659 RepID=UPI001E5DD19F|nr:winged helix DNA-binding domain-containing protein [Agromyces cavernae]MCD2442194.1 winged helix DNA-binding domain-containing protein [Agromyces cavernae]